MQLIRNSNLYKVLFSLMLGFLLIIVWINFIDVDELFFYFKTINIIPVIPAIIFYLMSYFLRSLRLRLLIKHKTDIPILKNYCYILAGNFINYLIPIRAGEVAKAFFYKKNHSISWAESLPAIFIDKIFDTFAIFIVLLMIPFITITLSVYLNVLLSLLIVVFFIGFMILFAATKVDFSAFSDNEKHSVFSLNFFINLIKRSFNSIFLLFPHKYKEKFSNFIILFLEGVGIFKHHKLLFIPCLFYTLLATLTDSVFFFLMFKAFSVDVYFTHILFGYTLIFLSYILPHPPAQIGSNELVMVLIFAIGFGLDENLVSAVMSFSHIITAVVIVLTGLGSTAYAGIKIFDFLKNKEIN